MLGTWKLLWNAACICGRAVSAGKDVILEIEIQGALKVKEKFPDTLLLFVTPPSAEELKSRLVGRGTETLEVIDVRMNRALLKRQSIWISMIIWS